ncbi:MAG: OmpH family outer membrane protein [Acidobacteriaceae bacterium]|nr:OmpH family outer membrane protein [Acidobacteriaceae bacterium]
MNRKLVFALAAGLVTSSYAVAQAPAAPAPAAAVKPEAVPAKVAVIAFEQAVVATNEGQKAFADIQKKYEPKKAQIDALASEVDSLKKQLQALPAGAPDDDRANRVKTIDTKEKQLQRDAEDAQNAYQGDIQEALGKISQKVGATAVKYAQENGFTMMINVGGNQQSPNPVLWFSEKTDITQAVVVAYNSASGIAAPPPSAPAVHRPATHTTAPKK